MPDMKSWSEAGFEPEEAELAMALGLTISMASAAFDAGVDLDSLAAFARVAQFEKHEIGDVVTRADGDYKKVAEGRGSDNWEKVKSKGDKGGVYKDEDGHRYEMTEQGLRWRDDGGLGLDENADIGTVAKGRDGESYEMTEQGWRWRDSDSGKGGDGKGGANEAGGEGGENAGGGEEKKKSKLVKAAKIIWNVVNAAPTAANAIVKETGAGPRTAKIAYAIALAGDYAVPGVPAGSLLVGIAASIASPKAPVKALKSALGKWREMRGKKKEEPANA